MAKKNAPRSPQSFAEVIAPPKNESVPLPAVASSAASPEKPVCGNCRHYLERDSRYGNCLRDKFPHVHNVTPYGLRAMFLVMEPQETCSYHEPR